jgi:hypothetical protein
MTPVGSLGLTHILILWLASHNRFTSVTAGPAGRVLSAFLPIPVHNYSDRVGHRRPLLISCTGHFARVGYGQEAEPREALAMATCLAGA